MDYVYSALAMIATFGGYVWCLFSLAFRWRTITHKYGRIDLYFWVVYINTVVWGFAMLSILAIWSIQRAIEGG